eukprot:maker-scaffold254_size236139-snap-gene-0.8 protein:Tk02052 transcript:maker-scaffold254_size236139-snap-gene-0.8-mRNA-1 annotation:"acyl carrier protein"
MTEENPICQHFVKWLIEWEDLFTQLTPMLNKPLGPKAFGSLYQCQGFESFFGPQNGADGGTWMGRD